MTRFLTFAVPVALALAAAPSAAHEAAPSEKTKVAVSAQVSPADLLAAAKAADAKVVVVLRNGMSYSASVKETGPHAVVLKGPAGKEFYEVYVLLAEVASVEVRVRDR